MSIVEIRMPDNIKILLLISSWGTGSTAVTGYLDKLGAYSCAPHFYTNDDKTPNSFEPLELRDLLNEYVNELDFNLLMSCGSYLARKLAILEKKNFKLYSIVSPYPREP